MAAFAGVAFACGDDGEHVDPYPPPPDASDALAPEAGPDSGAPLPKGARVLGLGLDIADPAYYDNLQTARDAGSSATDLTLAWDEIERPFDAGADADASTNIFHAALHVADLELPDRQTSLVLATPAIDVGGSRAPADLAGKALDDPAVIARFGKVEDYVLGSLVDVDLLALYVATDADGALGDDPAAWTSLATFVTAAKERAKGQARVPAIGFEVSAEAFTTKSSLLAPALAAADVVGVRYLAVDAAARATSLEAVGPELAAIAGAAAAKKVVVRLGAPSAAACASDEATQAAFVSAVFAGWDAHAAALPVVLFAGLDDAADAVVAAEAARAKRPDPAFAAMLGSLGLRSQAGARAKPSLSAFTREAHVRGF